MSARTYKGIKDTTFTRGNEEGGGEEEKKRKKHHKTCVSRPVSLTGERSSFSFFAPPLMGSTYNVYSERVGKGRKQGKVKESYTMWSLQRHRHTHRQSQHPAAKRQESERKKVGQHMCLACPSCPGAAPAPHFYAPQRNCCQVLLLR